MIEGFHWGILVASLVVLKFRVLLLIFLDCYFSFTIWWFMYCSVVFGAVESALKCFGGSLFEFEWPFVPQGFYPYWQIFSDPSLNFLVFMRLLSFGWDFFKVLVPLFNYLPGNLSLRRNLHHPLEANELLPSPK